MAARARAYLDKPAALRPYFEEALDTQLDKARRCLSGAATIAYNFPLLAPASATIAVEVGVCARGGVRARQRLSLRFLNFLHARARVQLDR